jgi:hypothetical protein
VVDAMRYSVTTLCNCFSEGNNYTGTAGFAYDDHDPLAVSMTVNKVTWIFSRDLLEMACTAQWHGKKGLVEFGDGDVRVRRDCDAPSYAQEIQIRLTSYMGSIELRFSAPVLDQFIEEVRKLVPPGTEVCNVDEWIEQIREMEGA